MPGVTAKAQNLCLNALVSHPQCGPPLVQQAKLPKPGHARRGADMGVQLCEELDLEALG